MGCAGKEWTGHHQSKDKSLQSIFQFFHRSPPPPGLPDWLIKPGYKHMTGHHTLANLMNTSGMVTSNNIHLYHHLMYPGHDGEETAVFHTSVVPEVAEVHVAHTQDGQEFELSHSIETES